MGEWGNEQISCAGIGWWCNFMYQVRSTYEHRSRDRHSKTHARLGRTCMGSSIALLASPALSL